ncbi:MAG: type II secretion system F family protein [Mariprofundus sp.]|nr:type II secretion system F family protein [Mariprofundus sp.]
MSVFSYEALDHAGRKKRGEIEADSERSARQKLKGQQLIVRKLSAIEKQSRGRERAGKDHLSTSETVLFLQQLSTLTEAGMPLIEALSSMGEGMSSQQSRRAVFTIRKKVLEGGALADALREQHFDEVICNMIAAGEETGQMEAVASRLAQLLEHRQALNNELLSATLYPAIILSFGIVVMLFLMAVVVPKMVAVFERAGGDLPTLTKVVIALSDFLRDHGGWLVVAIASLILLYKLLMRKQWAQAWRDVWLMRLPGISTLLITIDTARFSRTLGMLLSGGVPALAAMLIANQSWSLLPLKALGEQAREALREGESLSGALKKGNHIPPMATQLLAVGEQSGKLDAMLLRIADHYEKEVSRNLKRMLTIAEPLLVMFMAVGVGALAMAILLPIAEMNQLVK